MKYQFRSRSYPYGQKQPNSYAIVLSDVLAMVALVVILAAMIGIATFFQPLPV